MDAISWCYHLEGYTVLEMLDNLLNQFRGLRDGTIYVCTRTARLLNHSSRFFPDRSATRTVRGTLHFGSVFRIHEMTEFTPGLMKWVAKNEVKTKVDWKKVGF